MPYLSKIVTYQTRSSKLAVSERAIQYPRPAQLVVRVTHIGLNPIDVKIKAATLLPSPGGHLVGRDFCGYVVEVGDTASLDYEVGERVCGRLTSQWDGSFVGSYALIDVQKNMVMQAPSHLTDAEAASIPSSYAAAYNMLEGLDLNHDSRIFIIGGGTTVGSLMIQIAKLTYDVGFVATSASPSTFQWLDQIGADHIIDRTSPDFSEQLSELGTPNGFAAILDTVGGTDVWNQVTESGIPVGVYRTIVGDHSPRGPYSSRKELAATIACAPLMALRILISNILSSNPRYQFVAGGKSGTASEFFSTNPDAKVRIDSVFNLDRINEAWCRLDDGARGKIVVSLD